MLARAQISAVAPSESLRVRRRRHWHRRHDGRSRNLSPDLSRTPCESGPPSSRCLLLFMEASGHGQRIDQQDMRNVAVAVTGNQDEAQPFQYLHMIRPSPRCPFLLDAVGRISNVGFIRNLNNMVISSTTPQLQVSQPCISLTLRGQLFNQNHDEWQQSGYGAEAFDVCCVVAIPNP